MLLSLRRTDGIPNIRSGTSAKNLMCMYMMISM